MDPVQRAKQIVFGYNENPKDYTDEQAEQIALVAAQLGLPFRPESKALQKFFFDLVDNMAFGALPDDMRPTSRGESVFGETKTERAASGLALAGLALPFAAGARVAGAGARALAGRLPQRTQNALRRINTNNALSYAAGGGGGLAATNFFEDPAGAPSRAATGALIGAGIGVGRGLLSYSTPNRGGAPQLLREGTRQLPGRNQRLLGAGALRLQGRLGLPGSAPPRLGPSTLLQNTDDYLRTAINQAFI